MLLYQQEQQKAMNDALDIMNENQLRFLLKILLNPTIGDIFDQNLKEVEQFLDDMGADYMFKEQILNLKKSIDAPHGSYVSYYQDRIVSLMHDISKRLQCEEDGKLFETLAQKYTQSIKDFWDGYASPWEVIEQQNAVVAQLHKLVFRAIERLGYTCFSEIQHNMLSKMIGESTGHAINKAD